MDNNSLEKAKVTYATICKMFDNMDFEYTKIEDRLMIQTGFQGEDLPMRFYVRVNPEKELVSFISNMPFRVDESKRFDMALAVCSANYSLADGSFDYDLSDGSIIFRLTSSYKDTVLSEKLFEYMLICSVATIERYNDKFFMITKGALDIQKFIADENELR